MGRKKNPRDMMFNTTLRLPYWSFTLIRWVISKLGQKYEIFELDGIIGKNQVGEKNSPTILHLLGMPRLPHSNKVVCTPISQKIDQNCKIFTRNMVQG